MSAAPSPGPPGLAIAPSWHAAALVVLALPAHASLRVEHASVPHPEPAGFYLSRGLNLRARHYRHRLPDGRGLHVHVFRDHYRLHWDRVDPSHSLLGHFNADVAGALLWPFSWPRRLRRRAVSAFAASNGQPDAASLVRP